MRGYRPFPYAISVSDSSNIRFRNIHVDSNSAAGYCPEQGGCRQYTRSSKFSYGTCIYDPKQKAEVRDREFAYLDLGPTAPPAPALKASALLAAGAKLEKLAGGFYNASGAAVDAKGRLYFVDPNWHRIYRWTPETKDLSIIRDNPLFPVNLAFDKAGNLVVVSKGGPTMAVYAFKPDGPEDEITMLEREPPPSSVPA